jgi:hypothetical protein
LGHDRTVTFRFSEDPAVLIAAISSSLYPSFDREQEAGAGRGVGGDAGGVFGFGEDLVEAFIVAFAPVENAGGGAAVVRGVELDQDVSPSVGG